MKLRIVTEPAAEPVTLTEVKAHLRITASDDDTYLTSLITMARVEAERYTGRAFITQTLELALDAPPDSDSIRLPRAPLASVTSVKSVTDDGTETTMSTDDYHVDTAGTDVCGRIVLALDGVWPLVSEGRTTNQLLVRYVAGYGAAGSAVPEPLKFAIRELVRSFYDGEGGATMDERGHINDLAKRLLQPYRILRVH